MRKPRQEVKNVSQVVNPVPGEGFKPSILALEPGPWRFWIARLQASCIWD